MKKLLIISIAISLLPIIYAIPQTGHWEQLYPEHSPSKRAYNAITNAGEGRVLMCGGDPAPSDSIDVWLFDLKKNDWFAIPTQNDPPCQRSGHGFTKLNDSLFLLFGGQIKGIATDLNDTWIFNLNDSTWTEITPSNIPEVRHEHAIEYLTNNKILLFGGAGLNFLNDLWIYDHDSLNWINVFKHNENYLPWSRENVILTNIVRGKVLLYGGWQFRRLSDMWFFDINNMSWTEINKEEENPLRDRHAMCSLNENNVLIFGGDTGDFEHRQSDTDHTYLFRLSDSSWHFLELDVTPPGRSNVHMARIEENKALLFGGDSGPIYNDTWLFTLDPVDVKEEEKNPGNKITVRFENGSIIAQIYDDFAGLDTQLFNLSGEMIARVSYLNITANSRICIYNGAISPGMYFVKISTDSGTSFHKIIVVW
jgi:hypothetical protein